MQTNESFACAVRDHKDTVFRVAFSYMKNPDDAEDITQNVFLKLFQCRTAFESFEHLRSWLIRVTVNECKSVFRAPWRRTENLEDYAQELAMPTPEHTELFLTVMGLPEKYRIVIYLFYYEGYSTEEIAGLLGLPAATVRTRLARGRKKLRTILTEEATYD